MGKVLSRPGPSMLLFPMACSVAGLINPNTISVDPLSRHSIDVIPTTPLPRLASLLSPHLFTFIFLASLPAIHSHLPLMLPEQLVDNALVSAGLMDDPRGMVGRVNALMARLLDLHDKAK
jgi:hypothetical protein